MTFPLDWSTFWVLISRVADMAQSIALSEFASYNGHYAGTKGYPQMIVHHRNPWGTLSWPLEIGSPAAPAFRISAGK